MMTQEKKLIKPIKDQEEAVEKGEARVSKVKTSRLAMGGDKEFDQRIIDLARVTRVTAGGKRMRFRACVALGDRKGRVGMGLAKGADVTIAVNKAATKARKNLITVPMRENTIPHEIREKFGAASILLKPAPIGTGIIAGGAMRIILELAGVKDVVGKILGSNNKINNVKAVLNSLKKFKKIN